ncbi:MAG: hypothetical protein K6T83_20125 [Alicyclobacillus sp.]|nr:hypothetical protein [Alicyclobacillus sp.]
MCGITGLLYKAPRHDRTTGDAALKMLQSLCRRGPDSAGVALAYAPARPSEGSRRQLRIGVNCEAAGSGSRVLERLKAAGQLRQASVGGQYAAVALDTSASVEELMAEVTACGDGVSIASVGEAVEVLKCLGSADGLETSFRLSEYNGPAVIGHTRMATESRVDISHSQPLTAAGFPDLAIVHNGHITNYVKLRQHFESKGYTFQTDNDSEVIAVFLADRMRQGADLRAAMEESVRVLDGSFTYLALTPDALGLAREPFGMKPMVIAETDEFVAMASESVAIESAFEGDLQLREPGVEEVVVWRF